MFKNLSIAGKFCTVAVASLVAVVSLAIAPAQAQTFTLDNGGNFTFVRPTVGSTTAFISGTFTNPNPGTFIGSNFVFAFLPGFEDGILLDPTTEFLNFQSSPGNVSGGTFTGNIAQFNLSSSQTLGLYNFNDPDPPSISLLFNADGSTVTLTRNLTVTIVDVSSVAPEPGSLGLIAAGLIGCVVARRRRHA